MKDDVKHREKQTKHTSHWLHDVPETFDEAKREVERLQWTIRILVAIDLLTEDKARHAYEIASWS